MKPDSQKTYLEQGEFFFYFSVANVETFAQPETPSRANPTRPPLPLSLTARSPGPR